MDQAAAAAPLDFNWRSHRPLPRVPTQDASPRTGIPSYLEDNCLVPVAQLFLLPPLFYCIRPSNSFLLYSFSSFFLAPSFSPSMPSSPLPSLFFTPSLFSFSPILSHLLLFSILSLSRSFQILCCLSSNYYFPASPSEFNSSLVLLSSPPSLTPLFPFQLFIYRCYRTVSSCRCLVAPNPSSCCRSAISHFFLLIFFSLSCRSRCSLTKGSYCVLATFFWIQEELEHSLSPAGNHPKAPSFSSARFCSAYMLS